MKKVIVFGAAGRTGKYIVQYALEAGHDVTAFVHKSQYPLNHPNLKLVTGDVYEEKVVREAIRGNEVVISAIGTKQIEGEAVNLMSDAMKLFVKIMMEYGIKRVLAVGGLAVLQFNETMQMIDKSDYSSTYRNIGKGHNKVYKVLLDTTLDWTFVGCPDIIDGAKTGNYRVKKDYLPEGLYKINTGDLADFLVKEMAEDQFLQTRVGICNF